jgi:asparagine synthase (glutamine-hydrolysing)
MCQALHHRGPDGEGAWSDDQLALGMRRLSIIDLEGGWQPLFNEDHSLVLVANGEIYNFVELRADLERRGHAFRSGSDCETILHIYEEHGERCVEHLRGMFAFALWDIPRRRLLLARDRMGEKPLYLYERPDGKGLLFASELRAVLASDLVPRELDHASTHLYFYYQFVPEPFTPVRGVRKLPAGHTLSVDLDNWDMRQNRYWSMEDAPALHGHPGEILAAELREVARIIVRSDVPVGIALSGGLDSSAIAVLAAAEYPGTLSAFSIGYPGRPDTDERRHAEELANRLGIPFHDVELDTPRMVDSFTELVAARDDPIADISGFGYFEVMRLAREHGVPVMLQGQGGDELFWGYDWLRRSARASEAKDRLLRGDPRAVLGYLTENAFAGRGGVHAGTRHALGVLRDRGREVRRMLRAPREQMMFYDLTPDWGLAEEALPGLATAALLAAGKSAVGDPAAPFRLSRPWAHREVALTRYICESYLLENGITQGDRLSMASSVELRLPLVDYRLVETVVGLRKAASDSKLPAKAWFKLALRGLVPEEIMERPKRGFTPPVLEWHQALFARYGEQLLDGRLVDAGVLTREGARAMAKGTSPPGAIAPMSYKSLVLEVWCRKVLDSGDTHPARKAVPENKEVAKVA